MKAVSLVNTWHEQRDCELVRHLGPNNRLADRGFSCIAGYNDACCHGSWVFIEPAEAELLVKPVIKTRAAAIFATYFVITVNRQDLSFVREISEKD